MSHLINAAIFSLLTFAAIRLLARYPESRLGRIAFARLGPTPLRFELRSYYFLRWAAYAADWFVQALCVFAIGWSAWRVAPSLADSLPFVVLWLVVVPMLAIVSLAGAALAIVAFLWRRYVGAERVARHRSDPIKV
ncbi:MAG TPA: hypothetical protein VF814_16615 [Casimicrobiaceae bacterium]